MYSFSSRPGHAARRQIELDPVFDAGVRRHGARTGVRGERDGVLPRAEVVLDESTVRKAVRAAIDRGIARTDDSGVLTLVDPSVWPVIGMVEAKPIPPIFRG